MNQPDSPEEFAAERKRADKFRRYHRLDACLIIPIAREFAAIREPLEARIRELETKADEALCEGALIGRMSLNADERIRAREAGKREAMEHIARLEMERDQARELGRREGVEQAAKVAEDYCKITIPLGFSTVTGTEVQFVRDVDASRWIASAIRALAERQP